MDLTINHSTTIDVTPFSELCCQGIRVYGECVVRNLYALALLVVAAVCYIFSEVLAESYFASACYQSDRQFCMFNTYMDYGSSVINFSYNGCKAVLTAETEEEALRNHYGSDVIDEWLKIGTDDTYVDLNYLERIKTRLATYFPHRR